MISDWSFGTERVKLRYGIQPDIRVYKPSKKIGLKDFGLKNPFYDSSRKKIYLSLTFVQSFSIVFFDSTIEPASASWKLNSNLTLLLYRFSQQNDPDNYLKQLLKVWDWLLRFLLGLHESVHYFFPRHFFTFENNANYCYENLPCISWSKSVRKIAAHFDCLFFPDCSNAICICSAKYRNFYVFFQGAFYRQTHQW